MSGSSMENYFFNIALQAYIWGYPLVSNYNRFQKTFSTSEVYVLNDTIPKAPINQLNFLTHYVTPEEKGIVAPQVDTLYGSSWLDLGVEPIVIQVPEMTDSLGKEHYWILEFCDFYTNVFASPGTRRNSKPGNYLVVGPGWTGPVTCGSGEFGDIEIVEVIQAPTHRVYLLPRVLMYGPDDRENILPLIDQIVLAPLSQWKDIPKYFKYENVPVKWDPGYQTPVWVPNDMTFWDILDTAIDQTEIYQCDIPLVTLFREKIFRKDLSEEEKKELQQAITAGSLLVTEASQFYNLGDPVERDIPSSWNLYQFGGRFGTDNLTRAGAADSFIYYHLLEDCAYFMEVFDSTGNFLNGSNNYLIHFAPDNLPPNAPQAFWSVTVYNDQNFLYPNQYNINNVGTVTNPVFNPDGSLDIYLQSNKPDDSGVNWIPTPSCEEFKLVLRVYMPGDSVVKENSYYPPLVQLIK